VPPRTVRCGNLLTLLVVGRLASRDDSLLLLAGLPDTVHLFDLDLRARQGILTTREVLLETVLNAAPLRDPRVVVAPPVRQDSVDDRFVVRELRDPLVGKVNGLSRHRQASSGSEIVHPATLG
jgi:hypothetical protein